MKTFPKWSWGIFLSLFFLFGSIQTQAEGIDLNVPLPQKPRFERLTVEDGLPHATVLSVLQDKQGFMWFATADGFSRYDGISFKNFQHERNNANSLSNNNTFSLVESQDGLIWIGTDPGGLNVYDPETGDFSLYLHDEDDAYSLADDSVWSLLEDRDGNIWAGTRNGLSRLDRETGLFANYLPDAENSRSLAAPVVYRIYQDQSGSIWVGTNSGLQRYDPETDDFTTFLHDDDNPTSISSNNVWAMLEDSQGNFWVGTRRNGGVNLFDREKGTFTAYQHSPDNSKSISDDNIWNIYEDSSGNLWVLTTNGGLNLFDYENQTFTAFQNDPNDASTISNNDVFWMTEDRSGVLWITCRYGGVNKLYHGLSKFGLYRSIPENSNTLNANEIYSVLAEENGVVWIGTFGGGLNRFDRKTGEMTVYMNDPEDSNSLSRDKVYYIHRGENATLWLAIYGGGLNRLDTRSGEFTIYTDSPETPYGIKIKYPTTIEDAKDGKFWVGTLGFGFLLFNPETGEIEKEYEPISDDSESMTEGTVYDIASDSDGNLWIATARGGLEFFDVRTERFTHHLNIPDEKNCILSNTVHALYWDEENQIIWAATAGGLSGFNTNTGQWENYTKEDGLPSDTLVGIQPGEGTLWISTTKGISRLDQDTQTFYNYYAQDGLQGDQFQIACSHLGPDGEIFFGGSNGLTFFHPEDLYQNTYTPPIVFTQFFLNNLPVPAGGVTLPKSIEKTTQITLNYDQNVFSIQFAALSYQLSSKNLYSYKLDGFEENWSPASTSRGARYTNISPGTYTFMVRAANNDGIWNETPAELIIEILPPWWETWWFILLSIFVGTMLIWALFQLRLRNIRATNRKLEKRVTQRTQELQDAKDDLHRTNRELAENLGEVIELEKKVREQSIRDALTGLYNRHHLASILDVEIARAERSKHPIVFMLMDLDHFKNINDTYGHVAGDKALKAVGDLMLSQVRSNDFPFRYGGEEFMIIMPEITLENAERRAEEFRVMLNAIELVHEGYVFQVKTSIGLAIYPIHGENIEEMLLVVDDALYQAKHLGRDRVVVYTENNDCL